MKNTNRNKEILLTPVEDELNTIPFHYFIDSKYEQILLVNGLDEVLQFEYEEYNETVEVNKIVNGYYYELNNGSIYAEVIPQNSFSENNIARLLIDYSGDTATEIFDEAYKNKDWKTLYEHTKFLINIDDTRAWFSFQFIPRDQKYLVKPFAIITAFNPYMNSKDRRCVENFMANNELFLMLKEGNYHFLPSMGELSGYCEDSYIVYAIALDKAVEIGKIFQQQSIVYNDGKVVSIVDCITFDTVIEFNHFEIYKGK